MFVFVVRAVRELHAGAVDLPVQRDISAVQCRFVAVQLEVIAMAGAHRSRQFKSLCGPKEVAQDVQPFHVPLCVLSVDIRACFESSAIFLLDCDHDRHLVRRPVRVGVHVNLCTLKNLELLQPNIKLVQLLHELTERACRKRWLRCMPDDVLFSAHVPLDLHLDKPHVRGIDLRDSTGVRTLRACRAKVATLGSQRRAVQSSTCTQHAAELTMRIVSAVSCIRAARPLAPPQYNTAAGASPGELTGCQPAAAPSVWSPRLSTAFRRGRERLQMYFYYSCSLSEPAVADPRFIGPIDRHIVNNSHIF
jgi:hypothetical protein